MTIVDYSWNFIGNVSLYDVLVSEFVTGMSTKKSIFSAKNWETTIPNQANSETKKDLFVK